MIRPPLMSPWPGTAIVRVLHSSFNHSLLMQNRRIHHNCNNNRIVRIVTMRLPSSPLGVPLRTQASLPGKLKFIRSCNSRRAFLRSSSKQGWAHETGEASRNQRSTSPPLRPAACWRQQRLLHRCLASSSWAIEGLFNCICPSSGRSLLERFAC